DALDTAKRARAALESAGKTAIGEAAIRLVHVRALAATGDLAGASAALAVAKERLQARARTIHDHALRRAFTEAVAEHAATAALQLP
ncbi:MAG: hypothetical protein ACRELB_08070, partial [Polyangiaceae bacterium]